MRPRWYQTAAKQAIYDALSSSKDNPVVVLPTGAGKTIVIAELTRDVRQWGGRVLVLAHRKELLEQNLEKLLTIAPELDADAGVLSAGLGRREFEKPILVAGIQSAFRRACEIGKRDLVIVDEAHLVPVDGDGMYRTLLDDLHVVNRSTRVVGLTATPYRLDCGMVCGPDHFLTRVVFDVPIPALIAEGHLCRLTSKAAVNAIDTSDVHVRGGEFIPYELASACENLEVVRAACSEIHAKAAGRRSVLVFCSGRDHGRAVAEYLGTLVSDDSVDYLDGETPGGERAAILERFKAGATRYLVNIDVLTTGFDAPNVDCIALLRPTLSPGLYYQMVGRGLRTSPGKADCLILDFGGNVERHGPIDKIAVGPSQSSSGGTGEAPAKMCPECREVVPAAASTCTACGHEFPPREIKHGRQASGAAILSTEIEPLPVREVFYSVHRKRGAGDDAPRSMRVDYSIDMTRSYSEWICVEHTGFPRQKAETWWSSRSKAPTPKNADDAVRLANYGYLAAPLEIVVDESGEFTRVTHVKLGPIPETDAIFDTEGGAADVDDDVFSTSLFQRIPDDVELPF